MHRESAPLSPSRSFDEVNLTAHFFDLGGPYHYSGGFELLIYVTNTMRFSAFSMPAFCLDEFPNSVSMSLPKGVVHVRLHPLKVGSCET